MVNMECRTVSYRAGKEVTKTLDMWVLKKGLYFLIGFCYNVAIKDINR